MATISWQRAAQTGDITAITRLCERYPEDINRPGTFGGASKSENPPAPKNL